MLRSEGRFVRTVHTLQTCGVPRWREEDLWNQVKRKPQQRKMWLSREDLLGSLGTLGGGTMRKQEKESSANWRRAPGETGDPAGAANPARGPPRQRRRQSPPPSQANQTKTRVSPRTSKPGRPLRTRPRCLPEFTTPAAPTLASKHSP